MSNTEELHASIRVMQGLMKQAADRIEEANNALAESHTHDGIIKDREVQAIIESDADLIDHLRAAALPWDQRHKSTERPQSRAHQFPAEQVEAAKAELQVAVEAHGLTAKPEPTGSMGMPISCGKPLCSPGDHHPLCKLSAQPAQQEAWEHHAKKLTQWLHCMSYSDSYFGEPAGLVKQVTGALNRLIGAPLQPSPSTLTKSESRAKCWKCGDSDPAFTDICQVPACGMKEQA